MDEAGRQVTSWLTLRARSGVKRALRRAGLRVQPATVPQEYEDEPTLQVLTQYARSVRSDGDVVEAGVYQGRSAALLRRELPGRELFLLDTFAGMPPLVRPDLDEHRAGDFADTSVELVRSRVGTERVHYLVGRFSERLPEITDRRFAFAHIDCDLYESVRECVAFFGARMNHGGIMLLDDYGFQGCNGAKVATDEWAREVGMHPIWLPTGQAVVHF